MGQEKNTPIKHLSFELLITMLYENRHDMQYLKAVMDYLVEHKPQSYTLVEAYTLMAAINGYIEYLLEDEEG